MLSEAVPVPPPRDAGQIVFATRWVASISRSWGYTATAFGWTPWNIYLLLAGLIGWFAVGILWKDRAIILIHLVAVRAMAVGLAS